MPLSCFFGMFFLGYGFAVGIAPVDTIFFFCVCTCVGLHLVRVHGQLEKKEFRLHPGKEDTRSSRTQTVLEMFETRIFISTLD